MVEEKKECIGSETNQGKMTSVSDCANACKGNASMFIFGTNEFGQKRCDGDGCYCYCETDKNCDMVSHNGYRLYTFIGSSKYFSKIWEKLKKWIFYIIPQELHCLIK